MTWLDNAIGWLSPSSGVRRIAARRMMQIHGRAYDAAKQDPRNAGWKTAGTDANAEIGMGEETVRNRSRDLYRNNGFATQIIDTYADHVVGTGIVGAPTGLKGRNAKLVSQGWRDWSEDCDFEGDHDLNGLQWSAVKGMAESGAAIVRFRRQQFDSAAKIAPLKLQVLEPDFLDPMKSGRIGDGLIDRGIEYDADGRKVAYWLLPQHPGDVAQWRAKSLTSSRVPASEVVYLYNKLRPGQDRGMPILAPAVTTLQDLRGYMEAELVRKRVASCQVGVIRTPDDGDFNMGTDPATGQQLSVKYGRQVEKFEPGMWTRLFPGEQVDFNTPPNAPGVTEAAQLYLRQAAAGAGVMYEHATGDFSTVNYSSWRAGHHGFRRRMERIQWLVVVHKLCRIIAARYREAAPTAASLLPVASFGWRWTPPGFISVDPYKDSQADLANLRMGKVTLSQLVEERGYDYLEFLGQYAEDLAAVESSLGEGVMFDGDPRKALKPAAGDAQTNDAKANDAAKAA